MPMKDVKLVDTDYIATGWVWGRTWDGGQIGYPAIRFVSKSYQEVNDKAREGLQDGSLDSGFGFESLVGALLCVVKSETISVDEKEFVRDEVLEPIRLGELDEETTNLLMENLECG